MRHSKQAPTVNAGSMAGIAFLLLIFFLVTAVIPNDQGINRKLARICPTGEDCNVVIKEKNIFRIVINGNQEIMIEENLVNIDQVTELSMKFLDNNGDMSCEYCNGFANTEFSDNQNKAVISLQVDKATHYNLYVQVQDQLTIAYYELRGRFGRKRYDKSPSELTSEELNIVREAYPFLVSEATID